MGIQKRGFDKRTKTENSRMQKNHVSKPFHTMTTHITRLVVARQYTASQDPVTCHPLTLKPYRAASLHPRKILNTEQGQLSMGDGLNPVYDLSYCPVTYPFHRVLAVGDEQGWLSVVRVGFEGRRRVYGAGERGVVRGVECRERVVNRGVTRFHSALQSVGEQEQDYHSAQVHHVLCTLDWNWGGDKVLTGYGDGSIRIWDVGEGGGCRGPVSVVQAYEKSIKRVVWGSEATLISCSRTNEIRVHDNRMRNPLVNRIDTGALGCKLTDIAVLSPHHVASCSSNQPSIHLWDLRYTYKLYKRIKPVSSFDSSSAIASLAVDRWGGDGERVFYCLGVDGVIGELRWGDSDCRVLRGWGVPGGGVDYFSRLSVSAGVVVCGGSAESAWGFDVRSRSGVPQPPFFELREGRTYTVSAEGEELLDQSVDDADTNKENIAQNMNGVTGSGRCCSAVALGTRRGIGDCAVQIATGGDNSRVTVWD